MGYYFRQQHELLLVATRGNIPSPETENRPPSVIEIWYPRVAPNDGYYTVNVAVPFNDLFACMRQQMHCQYGAETPLPLPRHDDKQMSLFFDHAATM